MRRPLPAPVIVKPRPGALRPLRNAGFTQTVRSVWGLVQTGEHDLSLLGNPMGTERP